MIVSFGHLTLSEEIYPLKVVPKSSPMTGLVRVLFFQADIVSDSKDIVILVAFNDQVIVEMSFKPVKLDKFFPSVDMG